jgi:8-oxo-dGTP pyrophosphatase MutT (NUDIX family)
MNFDPQKFAIGVIDLFSVLLPGAILVYLTKDTAFSLWVRDWGQLPDDSWIVFGLASYLVGHLIFLVGAKIDDWFYDPLRNATYHQMIGRLTRRNGDALPYRWVRWLAKRRWLFGRNPDAAVQQAVRIKAAALAPLQAGDAINAFQWSKARLSKDNPSGFAAVQRFEADSKFFRSFVVALTILFFVYAVKCEPWVMLLCAGLILLSFWRYVDQRFKATQHAYWLIMTLEASTKDGVRLPQGIPPGAPTHAGGVVYRKNDTPRKYLVIQARRNPNEWVLPKGHIEPGEDPCTTAVREVREETGHWARVDREVGTYRLGTGDEAPFTRFYLMTLEEEATARREGDRGQKWLLPDEIKKLDAREFPSESRDVICAAEEAAAQKTFDH